MSCRGNGKEPWMKKGVFEERKRGFPGRNFEKADAYVAWVIKVEGNDGFLVGLGWRVLSFI